MAHRKLVVALLGTTALTLGTAVVQRAEAAACSSPYVKGDVFASVGAGTVNVFTPTGTFVCSLNDTTGATYTTGSGFELVRQLLRDEFRLEYRVQVR